LEVGSLVVTGGGAFWRSLGQVCVHHEVLKGRCTLHHYSADQQSFIHVVAGIGFL
jgi:hypothetical protein